MSKTPREPVGSDQSHADNEREVREAIGGKDWEGAQEEWRQIRDLLEMEGVIPNRAVSRALRYLIDRVGPPA